MLQLHNQYVSWLVDQQNRLQYYSASVIGECGEYWPALELTEPQIWNDGMKGYSTKFALNSTQLKVWKGMKSWLITISERVLIWHLYLVLKLDYLTMFVGLALCTLQMQNLYGGYYYATMVKFVVD